MELGKQQTQAFDKIMHWFEKENSRVFTLAGYAGTGKSTLAEFIKNNIDGKVFFCAYTGKAALNLRQKGITKASTIHRMIYKVVENSEPVRFELNFDSPARKAKLIIIDEYSMVNTEIMNDLHRITNAKILALGDPAQLPPVSGVSPLNPDFVMTEVYRQAMECPVLEAATYIRENGKLPTFQKNNEFGCFGIRKREAISDEALNKKFQQLIVPTNAMRSKVNSEQRAYLWGAGVSNLPIKNDKVICLQNDYDLDIYNGQIGVIGHLEPKAKPPIMNAIINFNESDVEVEMRVDSMMGKKPQMDRNGAVDFDYAYAITCHKAQGSEWDSVGVYVHGGCNKEWLYTAVTRARRNCIILR